MRDEDYHSLLTDEETKAQKVEYNNLPLGLELTVVELVCKLRALEWLSLYISLSLDVRKKTGTQCRSQHWGHTTVYQHAPIPKTQKQCGREICVHSYRTCNTVMIAVTRNWIKRTYVAMSPSSVLSLGSSILSFTKVRSCTCSHRVKERKSND